MEYLEAEQLPHALSRRQSPSIADVVSRTDFGLAGDGHAAAIDHQRRRLLTGAPEFIPAFLN